MTRKINEFEVEVFVQPPIDHIDLEFTVVPHDKPAVQEDGSVQVGCGDGEGFNSISRTFDKWRHKLKQAEQEEENEH